MCLSRNGITRMPDGTNGCYANCKHITTLDLSFNNLTTLPKEMEDLKSLRKLNISFNLIEELPACVCKLKALQTLLVGYNKLRDIPQEIVFLDALRELNLPGNSFVQFPRSITYISSLASLSLANNFISTIPGDISSLRALEALDISANQIRTVGAVCANTALTDLNLSNNKLVALPTDLVQLRGLTDLDVSRNQIREVPWAPSAFPKLRALNIAHNDIRIGSNSAYTIAHIPPYFAPGEHAGNSGSVVTAVGNTALDRYAFGRTARSAPAEQFSCTIRVGWSEMCGKRPDMQDALCVHQYFQHVPWQHLVGVFDGHSGSNSSLYCAGSVGGILADALESYCGNGNGIGGGLAVPRALRKTFHTMHREIEMHGFEDGCAAIVSLFVGTTLYVANSGDSRAVLCRAGTAVDLSFDHKPEKGAEQARIRSLGGFVSLSNRVCGELALTRSIGDCGLQPYVTWQPEITEVRVGPSDEFVLMACDGVWDVLTSQQAVDVVRCVLDPVKAAVMLRDCAYSRGSSDNLSVVVIRFSKA